MTDQNTPEDTNPKEESPVEPVETTAAAGASASDGGADELPYIDDPISKWWVAIIIAVFALIFAWAILFGAGGLFDGILDSDEAAATPEPTLVVSPSPEPSAEPTIVPTEEPTVEPSAEPTIGPCPTPDPSASPGLSPMPHESGDPSPIPCYTPAPEPSPSD